MRWTSIASTNKEELYIDDVKIATGTTADTGLSGNTIPFFLGCRNRNGSTDNPASMRIMSLNYKVFSDDAHTTLVEEYDFVPVRIGQTGYLLDKISRKLLGNAGTGDFTLGVTFSAIDLSSLTSVQAVIINSTNKWNTTYSGYGCWLIPVTAGALYKMKANASNDTIYAFLASSSHEHDTSVSFATGYTSRRMLTANTEELLPAPSDAVCMYVLVNNAGVNTTPQYIQHT